MQISSEHYTVTFRKTLHVSYVSAVGISVIFKRYFVLMKVILWTSRGLKLRTIEWKQWVITRPRTVTYTCIRPTFFHTPLWFLLLITNLRKQNSIPLRHCTRLLRVISVVSLNSLSSFRRRIYLYVLANTILIKQSDVWLSFKLFVYYYLFSHS